MYKWKKDQKIKAARDPSYGGSNLVFEAYSRGFDLPFRIRRGADAEQGRRIALENSRTLLRLSLPCSESENNDKWVSGTSCRSWTSSIQFAVVHFCSLPYSFSLFLLFLCEVWNVIHFCSLPYIFFICLGGVECYLCLCLIKRCYSDVGFVRICTE